MYLEVPLQFSLLILNFLSLMSLPLQTQHCTSLILRTLSFQKG